MIPVWHGEAASQCAHVSYLGVRAGKVSDHLCVPLCPEHHASQHGYKMLDPSAEWTPEEEWWYFTTVNPRKTIEHLIKGSPDRKIWAMIEEIKPPLITEEIRT